MSPCTVVADHGHSVTDRALDQQQITTAARLGFACPEQPGDGGGQGAAQVVITTDPDAKVIGGCRSAQGAGNGHPLLADASQIPSQSQLFLQQIESEATLLLHPGDRLSDQESTMIAQKDLDDDPNSEMRSSQLCPHYQGLLGWFTRLTAPLPLHPDGGTPLADHHGPIPLW